MSLNRFKFFGIVTLITIIVYYFQHIRGAEFVYEDVNWLNHNWVWSDVFTIPGNRLTLLTFIYNTPKIAHTINLMIHIFNSLILALAVEYWFFDCGWIVGSLFLVNPLASQAIAYASGRSELLSLTFLLGFLWFATISEIDDKLRWLLLLGCLFGISVTKVNTLIISMPLILWVYYNDTSIFMVKGIKYLFYSFLLTIPYMIYSYSDIIKPYIPLNRWIAVQTYASWRLSYEALTGQGLAIDHPWWLVSTDLQILSVVFAVLTIIIILRFKNYSLTIFGIGWWFIAFSPRLFTTVSLGWIREHHSYIPLVGLCIALGSLFQNKELQC